MQFKLREFSFLGKSLYAVEQRIQRPVFPEQSFNDRHTNVCAGAPDSNVEWMARALSDFGQTVNSSRPGF